MKKVLAGRYSGSPLFELTRLWQPGEVRRTPLPSDYKSAALKTPWTLVPPSCVLVSTPQHRDEL